MAEYSPRLCIRFLIKGVNSTCRSTQKLEPALFGTIEKGSSHRPTYFTYFKISLGAFVTFSKVVAHAAMPV